MDSNKYMNYDNGGQTIVIQPLPPRDKPNNVKPQLEQIDERNQQAAFSPPKNSLKRRAPVVAKQHKIVED